MRSLFPWLRLRPRAPPRSIERAAATASSASPIVSESRSSSCTAGIICAAPPSEPDKGSTSPNPRTFPIRAAAAHIADPRITQRATQQKDLPPQKLKVPLATRRRASTGKPRLICAPCVSPLNHAGPNASVIGSCARSISSSTRRRANGQRTK